MAIKVLARARITALSSVKTLTDGVDGAAAAVPIPGLKAITGAVTNGGLIRITCTAHGYNSGNQVLINGVLGTTEANGTWIVTVIDANTFDLQRSAFVTTYVSGGTANRERDMAKGVILQAFAKDVMYTIDGTVPTSTIGLRLNFIDPPTTFLGKLSALKFIESAASATLEIVYFRN